MSKRKQSNDKGKSPKLKRASTMENTANEGKEFLEKEAPSLVDTHAGKVGVETRGKQQARSTLDSLFSKGSEVTELLKADRKKEESKLKMVFRLFDKDKDGALDADELAAALRSCGKKPVKAKIKAILESVSKDKKNEAITSEQFVEYMMKKMFKEKKEEEKEKPTQPEKATKGKEEKEKEKETEKKSPSKKGKKAAKGKEIEEKKNNKGKEKEKVEPEVPQPIERARSITEFYTEHAGLNTEIVPEKLDAFSNPAGVEFDLGHEGAFNGFKILIGSFVAKHNTYFNLKDFESMPKPALQAKGFEFIFTTEESEFVTSLPNVDLAWIVSSSSTIPKKKEFVQAVRTFHESGGGLFIWGENDPFYVHANAISLSDLLGVTLTGNTPAHKTLTFGKPTIAGHFGAHLITSGISVLFEGRTVCYPASQSPLLQTVATSSDNHPVILVAEQGVGVEGLKDTCGRIVVDCGFTKLFVNWDTAGTARYVVNANVWLLGLDHKMRHGQPLSRVRNEMK